ncbi:MAG: FxsA family protein, partial [Solirubrobacterales bacterium]
MILLVTLLILWPIAELAAMVGVALWLGVLPMFGLLFLSTLVGLLILRYRGEAHWRRFRGALSERRPPAREAFDGTMITSGALLLVLPGFIS